jgi:hypothetical protein
VTGRARQNDATVPVQIRAVLHDPVHPAAELFLTDKTGAVVRLELVREGFSKAQFTLPVNGSLALYNSAAIEPRKPLANLAASIKLPPNIRQAMLIIHVTPGAIQPSVTTIVDTAPAVLPGVVPPSSAPSPASPRASTMSMKR